MTSGWGAGSGATAGREAGAGATGAIRGLERRNLGRLHGLDTGSNGLDRLHGLDRLCRLHGLGAHQRLERRYRLGRRGRNGGGLGVGCVRWAQGRSHRPDVRLEARLGQERHRRELPTGGLSGGSSASPMPEVISCVPSRDMFPFPMVSGSRRSSRARWASSGSTSMSSGESCCTRDFRLMRPSRRSFCV